MGISYYNGSGYPDPTAHFAVRNIEEEEKILHIQYPTGYMDIRMDKFFPATLDRAKKVFRLMARYTLEEEQDRLFRYLTGVENKYRERAVSYKRKAAEGNEKNKIRQYEVLTRKAERLQEQTKRNKELLSEICKLEVSE